MSTKKDICHAADRVKLTAVILLGEQRWRFGRP